MASSKSSSMVAVAVAVAVATLVAGAWCLDEEGLAPAPAAGTLPSFTMTVEEGSGGKKLVVFVRNVLNGGAGVQDARLLQLSDADWIPPVPNSASSVAAHDPNNGSVFTFETKEPLRGPLAFRLTYTRDYLDVIPYNYNIGQTYDINEADADE